MVTAVFYIGWMHLFQVMYIFSYPNLHSQLLLRTSSKSFKSWSTYHSTLQTVITKKSFYVVAMISGLKQAFKIDGSWIDHTKCVAVDAQIHFVDICCIWKSFEGCKIWKSRVLWTELKLHCFAHIRYGNPENRVWSMQQFCFLIISAYLLLERVNKSSPNNMMQLRLNIVLDCGHYMQKICCMHPSPHTYDWYKPNRTTRYTWR